MPAVEAVEGDRHSDCMKAARQPEEQARIIHRRDDSQTRRPRQFCDPPGERLDVGEMLDDSQRNHDVILFLERIGLEVALNKCDSIDARVRRYIDSREREVRPARSQMSEKIAAAAAGIEHRSK